MSPTSAYKESQSTTRVSDMPSKERIWQNINAVCELFDLARDIKMLELRRRHPQVNDAWILNEALCLIERGCR